VQPCSIGALVNVPGYFIHQGMRTLKLVLLEQKSGVTLKVFLVVGKMSRWRNDLALTTKHFQSLNHQNVE